jgi:hypothetical protein
MTACSQTSFFTPAPAPRSLPGTTRQRSKISTRSRTGSSYVSVKTIETQLSSSFRKLQITSRKQLPTALEGLQQ